MRSAWSTASAPAATPPRHSPRGASTPEMASWFRSAFLPPGMRPGRRTPIACCWPSTRAHGAIRWKCAGSCGCLPLDAAHARCGTCPMAGYPAAPLPVTAGLRFAPGRRFLQGAQLFGCQPVPLGEDLFQGLHPPQTIFQQLGAGRQQSGGDPTGCIQSPHPSGTTAHFQPSFS